MLHINDLGTTRLGLRFLSALLFIALSAFGFAQVSGSGTPNSVPIWTGTTTPSTTLGSSVITQNPNTKAISFGGPVQGPLGMLLYHTSFQGAIQNLVGTDSKIEPNDGFVLLQTDSSDFNALADLTSNNNLFSPDLLPGLDKSGTFVSMRLKPLLGPANPGQPAYFVAGLVGVVGNGFGFKSLGGANCGGGVTGGALKGVTILNGTETAVDLASAACTNKPAVDLFAIRGPSFVKFYVNGVLKGASTTNLPLVSSTIYDLQLRNSQTLMGGQTWWVSFLTVGIPRF